MSMSTLDMKDMEAEMKVDDEIDFEDEYECGVCGEWNTEEEFLLNNGCCFNCSSKLV